MTNARAPVLSPGGTKRAGRPGGLRWLPLVGWTVLIAVAFGVGEVLRRARAVPADPFPPLHAHARVLILPLLPAAGVALLAVAALPVAARRLPWRPLLLVAWLGSAGWAVLLQWPDGLARPLTTPPEYLAGLPAMGDHPLHWLRGFTEAMQAYPVHVKGHPPLPMLILWMTQWTGLRGAGWAAALVIAAGGSAAAAIAVTVRRLAGEGPARRAVPFLVLAPTAIWVATSMDALFLGVAAWGTALVAIAASRSSGAPRTDPLPPGGSIPMSSSRGVDGGGKLVHRLWITFASTLIRMLPNGPSGTLANTTRGGLSLAFAGGLLLGALPYLSYGLLPIFALPLAVLIPTRPARPILVALAAGCLVVPVAFTVAGFSWWDGVVGTHAAWAAGGGARRPYGYFLIGDLAVLALLIGPATAHVLPGVLRRAASTVRRRPPRLAAPVHPGLLGWLTAAALAGVIVLDLSGVTRGEVERIWLPYAAWLTTATAVYRAPARGPLLAQAVTALVIQALVRSPW